MERVDPLVAVEICFLATSRLEFSHLDALLIFEIALDDGHGTA